MGEVITPPLFGSNNLFQDPIMDSPAWGSFMNQNFPLPKFSPSDWLNTATPQTATNNDAPFDYFGLTADDSALNKLQNNLKANSASQVMAFQNAVLGGPVPVPASAPGTSSFASSSAFPSTAFTRPMSIPTALLTQQMTPAFAPQQQAMMDSPIKLESSPIVTEQVLPSPKSAGKRRASSIDTDSINEDFHSDHDAYEIHEGVERDGMIWGMKVEEYRALSARERKRVRNRISARTFRAKRKEHLNSLESDLNAKDAKIRSAQDEASRLRKEVASLKKRLSRYETIS